MFQSVRFGILFQEVNVSPLKFAIDRVYTEVLYHVDFSILCSFDVLSFSFNVL